MSMMMMMMMMIVMMKMMMIMTKYVDKFTTTWRMMSATQQTPPIDASTITIVTFGGSRLLSGLASGSSSGGFLFTVCTDTSYKNYNIFLIKLLQWIIYNAFVYV
jgi:hypothetical protein